MDWSKARILLIHSDIHVRRWAHDVLHKQKVASVQSTRSPAMGLDLLPRFAADVAVVQLCNRDMNGAEFVRRLRDPQRGPRPDLPVVVIADLDNPLIAEACEAGIHGVVVRPMTAEAFLARIADAIAGGPPVPAVTPVARPRVFVPAAGEGPAAPTARAPGGSGVPGPVDRPAAARPSAAPAPVARSAPTRAETPAAATPARRAARNGAEDRAAAVAAEAKSPAADTGVDIGPVLADHTVWLRSRGADGTRADLDRFDLHGRNLARVNLASAGLREADLSDADCRQAVFMSADLRRADLSAADLTGANLSVANLRGTNLRLARLAEASLRGADLAGACLSDAVLAGTDFAGANLLDTDLRSSDLTWAVGLTQPQIDKARADGSTRMPLGVRLPDVEEESGA